VEKIIEIDDKFLKISFDNNIIGTIKRTNLSKDKNEQRVDRFALEEKVDSIIILC
jgi:ribosomal protein S1